MTPSASALDSAFTPSPTPFGAPEAARGEGWGDGFGLEITLADPAADLRREIAELRQAVSHVEGQALDSRGGAEAQRSRGAEEIILSPLPPCAPAPLHPCTPAQDLLARNPLILDIETTALYKKDDPRPVEVAVIDSQGRVLLSTLINPQKPIPPEATAQHGITNADVADAPTWRQIVPLLKQILTSPASPPLGGTEGGQEARTVVAHNAKFDRQFIPPAWPITWACTKELANQILGKADWWDIQRAPLLGGSLPARLHQLGLPPGPPHTAAGDCLSTLRLLRRLAGETQPIHLTY